MPVRCRIVLQLAKHFEQLPDGIGRAERYYHQILEIDENDTKVQVQRYTCSGFVIVIQFTIVGKNIVNKTVPINW